MRRRFLAIGLLVIASNLSLLADSGTEIPLVPMQVLIALYQSPQKVVNDQKQRHQAFDWSWISFKNPNLDQSLVRTIQEDLIETKREHPNDFNHFDLPSEIVGSGLNPANGLEYILVVPHGADRSVDANFVYVYNPRWKKFVFKTCAFVGQ